MEFTRKWFPEHMEIPASEARNFWLDMQTEAVMGLRPGTIKKVKEIYTFVRSNGVMSFTPDQRGSRVFRLLDHDSMNILALIAWENEIDGGKSITQVIRSTKTKLGSHRYAGLITVPDTTPREGPKPTALGIELSTRKRTGDDPAAFPQGYEAEYIEKYARKTIDK